jgi:hypothetical protein
MGDVGEKLGKIRINITLVIHVEGDTDLDMDDICDTFMEQVDVPGGVPISGNCDVIMDQMEYSYRKLNG